MEKILEQYDNKYSVSSEGIIYSLKGKKKELKGKIGNAGYKEILINHKGIRKYYLVHRLVISTFIENKNNKRTVNHIDGNKLNNNLLNLEYNTDSENQKHAITNKLIKHKIDLNIANEIRNEKGTYRDIAKKYNLSKTQVGYIKQNKRWKN
jgi:hypothetical protein